MQALVSALFVGVVLLALVHFLLPREPLLHQARGRLSLRPPLPRLLGESTLPLIGLFLAAPFFLALLYGRVLSGVVILGLLIWWLSRQLWRHWLGAAVVFDRPADCIRHGSLQVGRTSLAAGVQVTGESTPALELFLNDASGAATRWPVPGVDATGAATVGRAIADYLEVPLVTRMI